MATTIHLKNSWRWVVTNLAGVQKTTLDRLATNVSGQYVLDDMSQFTCDVPSDNSEIYRHASDGEPFVSYGRRLVYGLRRETRPGEPPWNCRFAGIMTINQDQATADEPVTHLTFNDAWAWAKGLPVLTPDGSLLPEKGYTYKGKTGDYIAKDVLANAYTWIDGTWLGAGPAPPGKYPWPKFGSPYASNLFINITDGHYDTTDVLPSFPIQQGSSVYDVWIQLCQTGGLDIVLDPIYDTSASGAGVLAILNVYTQAGSDKPGAVFGWDMWPRNLIGVDDLLDGTQIENWVQFFAGGMIATNPDGSGNPYHAASFDSVQSYGPYFASRNVAGPSDAPMVGLLAAAEVALRKRGKQTLMVDPTPELSPDPFISYNLGDTVYAWGGRDLPPASSPPTGDYDQYGNALRHGIRSTRTPSSKRVYGFQIDLADDQVETITNLLLTDPDALSI